MNYILVERDHTNWGKGFFTSKGLTHTSPFPQIFYLQKIIEVIYANNLS